MSNSTSYLSPKMLILLLLGFSSGLPLALTAGTLQAWALESGLSLTQIASFSLLGWPYSVKFFWAPLIDRYIIGSLGRRRGWLFMTQSLLAIAVVLLGLLDPARELTLVVIIAMLVAFLSASQDIVIDAFRAENLLPEERGQGSAVSILGYRLGMLTSGAGALILADHLPWAEVYFCCAALSLVGLFATWWTAEPINPGRAPKNIRDAVVLPWKDYLMRSGALEILLFIILYKIGDTLAAGLTTPFMLQIGFTKTELGSVTKGAGLIATIVGALVGGHILSQRSLKASLLLFGILQAVSTLGFAALAWTGRDLLLMGLTVCVENFCGGLGTAAFTAFLISLCSANYSATQFALLSSLMAITRNISGPVAGFLSVHYSWTTYFILCTLAAIPGLLMLLRYDRWGTPPDFHAKSETAI